MNKTFKIKSRFYVITGDDEPIYVGYTNRTVKQRFREHLKDKDFSDYDFVEVSELSDYEKDFDFTWDYLTIQKDAVIVDNVERYLINKIGTQDSIYQKAFGGGQNWNDVKHFVLGNKNNPKFDGMSGSDIKKYLKNERECMRFLGGFVGDMVTPEEMFLNNFVGNMVTPEKNFLSHFVGNMKTPEERFLKDFVNHMITPEERFLNNFVGSMITPEERFLKSFVGNMITPEERFLNNFVGDMITPEERFLKSFVGNMKRRK